MFVVNLPIKLRVLGENGAVFDCCGWVTPPVVVALGGVIGDATAVEPGTLVAVAAGVAFSPPPHAIAIKEPAMETAKQRIFSCFST